MEKIFIALTAEQILRIRAEGKITLTITSDLLPTDKLDFRAIYEKYPRKLGKQKGLQKLKRIVRTENDYKRLEDALKLYLQYIKDNDVETKFIRHFDTWVNSWEDWLETKGHLPATLDWDKIFNGEDQ